MNRRRHFLRNAICTVGGGLILTKTQITNWGKRNKPEPSSMDGPLVISTWRHGLYANETAWTVLEKGGHALDAVEQGVSFTESDLTNRSVGLGGRPDREGYVTLDACIMDERSRCGSVAFLQHIQNPIQVARKVMEESPHVMLVGQGAYEFALSQGFEKALIDVPVKQVKREWLKWKQNKAYKPRINIENHDTIGMLALDREGRLSGACTTSGAAYKYHGRVGDSPIIGAGLFVDGEIGAAAATGLGEAVIRIAGSHTVVELMRSGASPFEACKATVERLLRKHGAEADFQVGFIAIDKTGNHGGYSIFNGFEYALHTSNECQMVKVKSVKNW